MAGTKTQQQKANGKRAAIYARVSDKSQAEDDKTSLSEQIGDMEAHCEDKGMTVTARYQEVGRAGPRSVPSSREDAGGCKAGTLRHHRLLEIGPAQPGDVPRRRPHGGHRGVPHQPGGRHGRHRHEDLRPHGCHRQDRAGQLPGEGVHGQAGNGQAGEDTRQQRPLRLPHRRRRQAADSGGRGRGGAPRLPHVRQRWDGSVCHCPSTEPGGRAPGETRKAMVLRHHPSHSEQRDL